MKSISLFFSLFCILQTSLYAGSGNPALYVSTNRASYLPGEPIRFQALVISERVNEVTTLVVELYDSTGQKAASALFPVSDNFSSGSINMPSGGESSYYLLYCYTVNNQQREADFTRRINKAGSEHTGWQQSYYPGGGSEFTFFTEGRSFTAGIPNNLLIKTSSKWGLPLSASVTLTDDKKKVIAVLRTNCQGLSKNSFIPETGSKYFLSLKEKDGFEKTVALPEPSPFGVAVSLSGTDDTLFYKISSFTTDTTQTRDYLVHISSKNEVVYEASVGFEPGYSDIMQDIRMADLPEGFLGFEVVDKKGRKVAERLFYNPSRKKPLHYSVTLSDTLRHLQTTLSIPDCMDLKGYISLDAIPKSSPDKTNRPGISQTLQLPALESPEDNTSLAFNDQLIQFDKQPYQLNEAEQKNISRYLTLSGTAYDADMNPLKNQRVSFVLIEKNLRRQFLEAKTDTKGRIELNDLLFFDSTTVYYQLAGKSDNKNQVIFKPDRPVINTLADSLKIAGILASWKDESQLTVKQTSYAKDSKTLKEVVVKTEKTKTDKELFDEKYVAPQNNFRTAMKNEFDFLKEPASPADEDYDLVSFIQGRISGIIVYTSNFGKTAITATDGSPMTLYLDDMELRGDDADLMKNLYIRDVAYIRYYGASFSPKPTRSSLTDGASFSRKFGGTLVVYTKHDYQGKEKNMINMKRLRLKGYDVDESAIQPAAGTIFTGNIFWKPGAMMAENQVIYLNLPENYRELDLELTIEGINSANIPFSFSRKLRF